MQKKTMAELTAQATVAMMNCRGQPAAYYTLHFEHGGLVCEPTGRGIKFFGWQFKLTRMDITQGLKSNRWDELEAEFKNLLERSKQCPDQSKH